MSHKYDFISKKHSVFSVDKITQIIFIESIFDKLLGTCSISFYSIGSSDTIKFFNIKKTPNLFENVLSKVGFYKDIESQNNNLPINNLYGDLFKSNILTHILFILFTIFTLFIPYIIYVIYKKYYYSQNYYNHTIYNNFIESCSGIFFQTKKYASLNDIKAIESIKYPLTSTGDIYLDISGDNRQKNERRNKYTMFSNTIKIPMVKQSDEIFEKIDNILNKKEIDKTIEIKSRQDLGNTLIWTGIIFLPTVILYPFIIGGIIWYIRSIKYVLEKSRIVIYSGIIYKTRKSVLYKKINFIEKNESFLNKIFGNGNISIFTKGSGFSDVVLKNTSAKNEIYDLLKQKVN